MIRVTTANDLLLSTQATRQSAAATGVSTTSSTKGLSAYQSASDNLSSLSRQLSAAAARAETRNATLSRDQLKTLADDTQTTLADTRNKVRDDAEVPDSTDPQRLAQAQQATDYLNGKAPNPFKGLNREQLALVTYDDSGAFTLNERRAALEEADAQEQTWRHTVTDQAKSEYALSGKLGDFYKAVLEHFQSLSDVEQSQYPANYASNLQMKIAQATVAGTTSTEEGQGQFVSLIEMLAQDWQVSDEAENVFG